MTEQERNTLKLRARAATSKDTPEPEETGRSASESPTLEPSPPGFPSADNNALILLPRELGVDRNPALVYLARLAFSGRRSMISALNGLAHLATNGRATVMTFAWHRLKYQHAAALLALARDARGPASLRMLRAALRQVLKESWRLGFLAADDYQKAIDLPIPRYSRLPRGRALSAGEIQALFAVCWSDPRPTGRRDAAILAVLYGCGLRLTELINLDVEHYDTKTGTLRVVGKGDKERIAHCPVGTVRALVAWLACRGRAVGPLFVASERRGLALCLTRRLGQRSLQRYVCAARARQAGVAGFSPHDLRRTLISDLLEATGDLSLVASIVGHSDLQTTRRYDRRPEGAKRKAANRVHVPFRD